MTPPARADPSQRNAAAPVAALRGRLRDDAGDDVRLPGLHRRRRRDDRRHRGDDALGQPDSPAPVVCIPPPFSATPSATCACAAWDGQCPSPPASAPPSWPAMLGHADPAGEVYFDSVTMFVSFCLAPLPSRCYSARRPCAASRRWPALPGLPPAAYLGPAGRGERGCPSPPAAPGDVIRAWAKPCPLTVSSSKAKRGQRGAPHRREPCRCPSSGAEITSGTGQRQQPCACRSAAPASTRAWRRSASLMDAPPPRSHGSSSRPTGSPPYFIVALLVRRLRGRRLVVHQHDPDRAPWVTFRCWW